LSKKYKQIVPLYRYFGRHWEHCLDFSDDALFDLYTYESTGRGQVKPDNGFANGKKWMDVAVAQWREDFGNTLWVFELYEDPDLPDWWLDKVLGTKSPS
jgi:hypothetical protein